MRRTLIAAALAAGLAMPAGADTPTCGRQFIEITVNGYWFSEDGVQGTNRNPFRMAMRKSDVSHVVLLDDFTRIFMRYDILTSGADAIDTETDGSAIMGCLD